jgi:peptide/nickel transport system substrate-binding protein
VLAACGGDAATDTPAAATEAPQAPATAAPAVTAAPAAPAATTASAAVPRATAAPAAPAAGDDSHYSEAAKILMSDGALALAEANGEKPRYGGKFLTSGPELIPSADMHQTSFGGVYTITAPIYNGLLATSPYDPLALELIPDLATSWEIADEGATITFHLAENVKWHDGASFSSEDVRYTIERIMFPPDGMVSPRKETLKSLIESVDAPDPNTIVINGRGPSPLVVAVFANGWQGIIPKHIVEPDPVNALKTAAIGTGPFKLKKEPTTLLWEYERNPDYFKADLPYLDEMDYNIILDQQVRSTAILTERTFWNEAAPHPTLTDEQAQALASQEDDIVISNATILTESHLALMTERAPFDDIRVRQAISEAIDRAAISDVAGQKGTVGTGNFPLGPWALPPERQAALIGYGLDMEVRQENARRLLAEYEAEKGEIDWSSMRLQCSTNIAFSIEYCQIIQPMLKEVGIDIELDPADVSQTRGNEVSGNFDMSLLGAGLDFDDPTDTFGQLYITNGGRWYQRRSIPELDELYEAQKFEPDFEKRRELTWQMDEIAMNDSSYMIMHWFLINHARWNYVKGWTASANIRSTNARMEYVWLDWPDLPTSRP